MGGECCAAVDGTLRGDVEIIPRALEERRRATSQFTQRFVYKFGLLAPDISVRMVKEIYLRLETTGTSIFSGQFCDMTWLEYHSYPNERKQQWKLTDLEDASRFHSHWEEYVKKADGNSKDLIEPLGLPESSSPIFCYYVQDRWAWRLIKKYQAGTGREMTTLMKAEVLKQIRAF